MEVFTFDKNAKKQEEFFPIIRGTFTNTVNLAERYFKQADMIDIGEEFAAHVAFGLVKCDQARNQEYDYWGGSIYASPLFARIAKDYSSTKYAEEVRTNCVYYYYYDSFLPEGEEE